MKKILLVATAVWSFHAFPAGALAQDTSADTAIEQEETSSEGQKDNPKWTESLKSTYSLTDSDIQAMKDKGMGYPQMAIVSGLAAKSGKTRDEIIAMRKDQKMGWGKIAKTLGIAPKEIGQSVANTRRAVRDDKMEKREDKMAKREEKMAKRADKMEKRDERRAEREAKKAKQ